MKRYQIVILLFVLCGLVYANSLQGEFISDDIDDIIKNPLLGRFRIFWHSPHNLLNSLIYKVFSSGTSVPYHIVSVLLHGVMSVLVFLFLNIFFRQKASMLGAALFAVHPIHVEAVSWISGRPYIMLGLFTMFAFLTYHKATEKVGRVDFLSHPGSEKVNPAYFLHWRWYAASLAIFAYYIYKNYAFFFMFPVMILVYDLVYERIRKTWPLVLPYFMILAVRLLMNRAAISGRALDVAKQMEEGFVWTNPFFNLVYSFYTHLGLVIWPDNLSLYHEPPVIMVFWLRMGMIGLVVIGVLLGVLYKKAKPLCFGLLLFGMFLAPTYSPVTISWLLAERYAYVPSIFLSFLLAFSYEKYIIASIKFRRVGLVLCTIIIAGYAVRTVARNEEWRSADRLWRVTVVASPDSPRAHNNMGDLYAHEGNYGRAIEEFKKSTELKPNYADGFHNLANIYEVTGNNEEAVKNYARAIELNPDLYQSYERLALIYDTLGDEPLSVRLWNKAQEIRRAVNARGNVFTRTLEPEERE